MNTAPKPYKDASTLLWGNLLNIMMKHVVKPASSSLIALNIPCCAFPQIHVLHPLRSYLKSFVSCAKFPTG